MADSPNSFWMWEMARSRLRLRASGCFSLAGDAAGQFWVACLHNTRPQDMVTGFVGYYRRQHAERFRALNEGYVPDRTLRVRDVISEHLDTAGDRLNKLHEAVADGVKEGPERLFGEMTRLALKLVFPKHLTTTERIRRALRSPS